MRPIFTIHAGEFIVGEYIEREFRGSNVWIPAKDTGIDLLVTDKTRRRIAALQVKFSRDFVVTEKSAEFRNSLRASGWWTFDRRKIADSAADFWVLVVMGFKSRNPDFIIIKPTELLARLTAVHGSKGRIQSYFCVTKDKKNTRCWETRGLKQQSRVAIAQGRYRDHGRDFSRYLNNWESIGPLRR